MQEHKQLANQIDSGSSWARRHGWKSLWSAAVTGDGQGPSSGVALFVRDGLGLRAPDSGAIISPARAVAGIVEVPGQPTFLVMAAYFHDCQDLSDSNIDILCSCLSLGEGLGFPFLLGADFNMEPEKLLSGGLGGQKSVQLLVPEGHTMKSVA
eukprot:2577915-Pyramimonas_sp.AAC.1